ncbi:MAG: hypothetical protein E6J91_15975 [Deltaproteobacteria bacterium]|nr:MAG: hypothetical protein E6J91_15975 [Deltaproteobacteria bacterium]
MKLCLKCQKQFTDDANFCPVDAARLVPLETQSVAADGLAAKFDLGDRLGGSRTGAVHRATDKASGQPAAVKIIAPAVIALPGLAQRLERELKQLERVQSEGVARVLASGKRGDDSWVALELLDGAQTLAQAVAVRGPMPLSAAAQLITVIGEALIEAAQVGVVHRDLAPKNILFSGNDVKLINFSLPVPTSDKVPGVAEFVAPEQHDGKPVDQRSNLYSLGALYYFVLTGPGAGRGGDPARARPQPDQAVPDRAPVHRRGRPGRARRDRCPVDPAARPRRQAAGRRGRDPARRGGRRHDRRRRRVSRRDDRAGFGRDGRGRRALALGVTPAAGGGRGRRGSRGRGSRGGAAGAPGADPRRAAEQAGRDRRPQGQVPRDHVVQEGRARRPGGAAGSRRARPHRQGHLRQGRPAADRRALQGRRLAVAHRQAQVQPAHRLDDGDDGAARVGQPQRRGVRGRADRRDEARPRPPPRADRDRPGGAGRAPRPGLQVATCRAAARPSSGAPGTPWSPRSGGCRRRSRAACRGPAAARAPRRCAARRAPRWRCCPGRSAGRASPPGGSRGARRAPWSTAPRSRRPGPRAAAAGP